MRAETGQDPGAPRAGAQWARLAFPMTFGEQGAFLAAGLPAVLLSASGERPPAAGAAVSEQRLEGLRPLRAARDLRARRRARHRRRARAAPRHAPQGAARLGGPAARRRGAAAGWIATLDALRPGAAAGSSRSGSGCAGCSAPRSRSSGSALLAVAAGARRADPGPPAGAGAGGRADRGGSTAAAVLGALALAFALGWFALRPLLLRGREAELPRGNGHAAAVLVVLSVVRFVVWLREPVGGRAARPPRASLAARRRAGAQAAAGAGRRPRPGGAGALPAGGPEPGRPARLRPGGRRLEPRAHGGGRPRRAGRLGRLVGAGRCGASASAMLLGQAPPERPAAERVTVRGPRSYAGPGSLGGTDSAFRR